MKAIIWQAPKKICFTDADDPKLLNDTDVIVRVSYTTICGTDLYIYRGAIPGFQSGTIIGHEFLGTIVESGAAVNNFKVGDFVYSADCTACGLCENCLKQKYTQCPKRLMFGFSGIQPRLDGGQAEYVRVPFADLTLGRLDPNTDIRAGLLAADVLPTAMAAIDAVKNKMADNIAVIGSGPVGFLIQYLAKQTFASEIFALDTVNDRLNKSESIGIIPIRCESNDSSALSQIRKKVDVVIDAAGGSKSFALAQELVLPGGQIVCVGSQQGNTTVNVGYLFQKEIEITFVLGDPIRYRSLILKSINENKKLPLDFYFSEHIPLAESPQLYQEQYARNSFKGLIKVSN
jgi:alcohol dehydrogenase